MKTPSLCGLIGALATTIAVADTRSSASYSITTDTLDSAGEATTSALYSNVSSAGGFIGVSTGSPTSLSKGISPKSVPSDIMKHGYIGQLYDATSLTIAGASPALAESSSMDLQALLFLDDDTTLALSPSAVDWGISGGPLRSISSSGLVTANSVYQDTLATVKGHYHDLQAALDLTVLNTLPDNFGTYASDGLPDSWQIQHFGFGNPQAAPTADPSGNGQNNLFKYTAGLDPNDPLARFMLDILPVPGQSQQYDLVFHPIMPGRTYVVKSQTSFSDGGWTGLGSSTTSNAGNIRTVRHLNATESRRFYRVEITVD